MTFEWELNWREKLNLAYNSLPPIHEMSKQLTVDIDYTILITHPLSKYIWRVIHFNKKWEEMQRRCQSI